jgi:hypothetical protein
MFDNLRLTYQGDPLNMHDAVVSDYVFDASSVITVHMRGRGGMAKKGVKKITKQEKMASLRATTLYRAQATPGIDQILAPLNAPDFIPTVLLTMPGDTVNALSTAVEELRQVREDSLFETITPFFVPTVAQWKQQIADLENRISTVESAMSTVFCDSYYVPSGFDYKAFFNALQARVDVVEADRIRTQIQAETIAQMHAQAAQMQAAQAAPAAAAMDDD